MEYRQTPGRVSVSRASGKPVIAGYAAVFYDPADAGTEFELFDRAYERIIHEVQLFDVGPVTFPAYRSTTTY